MATPELQRMAAWQANQRYARSDALRDEFSSRRMAYTMPDFTVVGQPGGNRTLDEDAKTWVRDCAYRPACPEFRDRTYLSADGVPGGHGRALRPQPYKRSRGELVPSMSQYTDSRFQLARDLEASGSAPNVVPLCIGSKLQCLRERYPAVVRPLSSREGRITQM